jgi:hypothetical protein
MTSHAEFNPSQIEELARFVAELTRQGIRYFVAEHHGLYRVNITGF